MVECDNCGKVWQAEQLQRAFPDIPDLLVRIEPGGTVPAGECPDCGALVYPVKECLQLSALRHAHDRLNAIPHRYADTDFGLIRRAIEEAKKSAGGLVPLEGGPGCARKFRSCV